jgi:hypothetical protein
MVSPFLELLNRLGVFKINNNDQNTFHMHCLLLSKNNFNYKMIGIVGRIWPISTVKGGLQRGLERVDPSLAVDRVD